MPICLIAGLCVITLGRTSIEILFILKIKTLLASVAKRLALDEGASSYIPERSNWRNELLKIDSG